MAREKLRTVDVLAPDGCDRLATLPGSAGQDGTRSKSTQELKTENRNSKDWSGRGSLNWAGREERA